MKFTKQNTAPSVEILANDHYVAVPYDCSSITANSDGVIKAGTIVPANDGTAIGVLLTDVVKSDNPNGSVVIHGVIKKKTLPTAPADTVKISQITFLD